jgi:molybdopterin-binding protein
MNITLGGVMAEVTIDIGNGSTVVSAFTRTSVENMGIHVGSSVVADIKATEVLVGLKDWFFVTFTEKCCQPQQVIAAGDRG